MKRMVNWPRLIVIISLFALSMASYCGGGGGGSPSSPPSRTLVSISVTPVNPRIPTGDAQQFAAYGTYSDGTSNDITTQVAWSSSNTSVVTINSSGLATSVAVGTATIAATSGSTPGSTALTVTSRITGDNVLPITVNGPGLNNSYPNEPCVSVTICTPGTTTCQTINDILLDTGDYGLRIFKQALTVPLTQVTIGTGSLAECVQYADGSGNWGPVQMTTIILGNEPGVQVPIQVIDSTFGTAPSGCGTLNQSPSLAGYNGSLGLGLFVQDCGQTCTSSANNLMYYSCSGSTCSPTAVALTNQVQNPVGLLPLDNNGVIVQLESVSVNGYPSVNGILVLGIGTQANNVPSGVTAYAADQYGEFTTKFNGTTYSSFIDSGSNGLFFPSPGSQLPDCPAPNPGWYCPSFTASLSATNSPDSGSPSGTVSFQIGNFDNLISSSNNVFDDIGGSQPGGFDWGLPFFLGRNVYVGLEGKGSSLGNGPYWAY